MSLDPSEVRELFERECHFPTDRDTVVEAIGEVAIASPGGSETEIRRVLDRSDQTDYESASELHSTVMANLTDDHIGRKHYDDRSSAGTRESEVSF